ncbi:MAG: ATP-grasp domain-containing protein [Oscillospiraceae bacterium]|nr:ATP-grasp domain-containing protein [Oscillospiraceae bacterium]
MKTIIFIGANKSGSSFEAIKASAELHYYTVLLTDRKSFFDKRMDFPHVHSMRMCNLESIKDIKSAIARIDSDRFTISAIVSFVDPHCHTAALLSREFGLKPFTEQTISIMLDKSKSRDALRGTPYSPSYHVIDGTTPPADPKLELPFVLKAPISSASKDVHAAATTKEYQTAFADLRKRYPDGPILVEKYLTGPQYLVETLTIDGEVHIAAVVRQEILFSGRFIVTGYQIIPETDSEFYKHLKQSAEAIILAHGMQNGPCHLELRRLKNDWKLIEANPRISGGAMNLFIETAYGINLTKETLKAAIGQKPDLNRKYTRETFLQYVVVPGEGVLQKVTGKSLAQNSPGVRHVYIKPKKGSILLPPISMGHRYAYVIATGGSAKEARVNAKTGASKIKFHFRASDAAMQKPPERRTDVPGTHAQVSLDYFAANVVYEP